MSSVQKRLFWIFDLIILLVAFLSTSRVAPFLHQQLSFGGILYGNWIEYLEPTQSSGAFPPLREYLWVFVLMAPATVIFIEILGGHLPIRRQGSTRILLLGISAPLVGVAMLSTMFFVFKTPGYSRLVIFSFAGASAFVICGSRFLSRAWHHYKIRDGMYAEGVAIVGMPKAAKAVAEHLRRTASSYAYKLVGYFSLVGDDDSLRLHGDAELPILGNVKDLEKVLICEPIQRIVIILPESDSHWLGAVLKTCDYFRVTTDIMPETILTSSFNDLVVQTDGTLGRLPVLTLAPPEAQSEWLYIKRVLDVCVSIVLLILLAPLLLLLAIAIKLTTPHLPVFYSWHVVGYRGQRFTGYKFTTMFADAGAKIAEAQFASLNEMTGPVFKIANDPRVTRFGRFLRKYSLNELPQLWSVLKGDMSLVGPRPAWPHELERYEVWHKRKLSAKPGITCLWQIRGRNKIINFDDRVRMDLEYIRDRSFLLDCKILVKTAWVVVRGTGS